MVLKRTHATSASLLTLAITAMLMHTDNPHFIIVENAASGAETKFDASKLPTTEIPVDLKRLEKWFTIESGRYDDEKGFVWILKAKTDLHYEQKREVSQNRAVTFDEDGVENQRRIVDFSPDFGLYEVVQGDKVRATLDLKREWVVKHVKKVTYRIP